MSAGSAATAAGWPDSRPLSRFCWMFAAVRTRSGCVRRSRAPARPQACSGRRRPGRLKPRLESHEVRLRGLRGLRGPAVCGVPNAGASAAGALSLRFVGPPSQRSAPAATVHEGGLRVFPAANSFAPAGGTARCRFRFPIGIIRSWCGLGGLVGCDVPAPVRAIGLRRRSEVLTPAGMSRARTRSNAGTDPGTMSDLRVSSLSIFFPILHVPTMSPIWRTSRT
jgi:hypothetical protein